MVERKCHGELERKEVVYYAQLDLLDLGQIQKTLPQAESPVFVLREDHTPDKLVFQVGYPVVRPISPTSNGIRFWENHELTGFGVGWLGLLDPLSECYSAPYFFNADTQRCERIMPKQIKAFCMGRHDCSTHGSLELQEGVIVPAYNNNLFPLCNLEAHSDGRFVDPCFDLHYKPEVRYKFKISPEGSILFLRP